MDVHTPQHAQIKLVERESAKRGLVRITGSHHDRTSED